MEEIRALLDEADRLEQESRSLRSRAAMLGRAEEQRWCPGHVASHKNPKVCGRCGIHIDELR